MVTNCTTANCYSETQKQHSRVRPQYQKNPQYWQYADFNRKTLFPDNFTKISQKSYPAENKNALKRGQILLDGKIFVRSDTQMFRIDLDWAEFKKYLKKNFSGYEKVNTLVYGCSDGSEAYTMSILLQNAFGDEAGKFFPIFAKDIDTRAIERNKERQNARLTPVFNCEIPAKYSLNLDSEGIREYMEIKGLKEFLLPNVTKPVVFSVANILEDIENIDFRHPSIVMMRNMWPYISPDEYFDYANRLYERLAPGSIVVIGSFDCTGEPGTERTDTFPPALLSAGFEEPADGYNPDFLNDEGHYTIFEKR